MQRTFATVAALLLVLSATSGVAAAHEPSHEPDVPECEFPFTATDATDVEVTVEERPERVTTLNPSAAQTMWEIGGKDQVVGVSKFAVYLDGAEERTNVSTSGFGVSVEKVVGTNPDLVLAPNSISNETVEKLRDTGLTVFKFERATSIADVRAKTALTGKLTGNCEGAAETNAWMDANVETAREVTADVDRPTVLYPLGGGYVAADETFIDAMIEAAGGENVAGGEFAGYPKLSDEVLLELEPEVLVLTAYTTYLVGQEPYASMPAVENDRTYTADRNYMNQPAPRSVVYSVRNLTAAFHPEAHAEAEWTSRGEVEVETATPTPSPTPEPTESEDTATPTAESTPEPTGSEAPGFGPVVGALAVVAATLLFTRE